MATILSSSELCHDLLKYRCDYCEHVAQDCLHSEPELTDLVLVVGCASRELGQACATGGG
jgi:hypothetical protein